MPMSERRRDFIKSVQQDDFKAHFEQRFVQEINIDPHKSLPKTAPRELVDCVVEQFTAFQQRDFTKEGPRISCINFNFAPEDGLSWCAQAILQRLTIKVQSYGEVACVKASRSEGSLPDIKDMIGTERLRRILERGLIPSRSTFRTAILPICLAAAAAFIKVLSDKADKEVVEFWITLWNWKVWILAIAAGGVGYWTQRVINKLRHSEDISEGELSGKLRECQERGEEDWTALYKQLKDAVRANGFRLLIVDDFGHLDPITRDLLVDQFINQEEVNVSEFWVIIDENQNGNDSFRARLGLLRPEFRERVRVYSVNLIDPNKRISLAQRWGVGTDHVEGARVIKHICEPGTSQMAWIVQTLKEYRTSHPFNKDQYDALDLLQLISLIATTPIPYESFDWYRTTFGKPKGLEEFVLKRCLPGVHCKVDEMDKRLLPVLTPNTHAGQPSGNGLHKLFESQTEQSGRFSTVKFGCWPEVKRALESQVVRKEIVSRDPALGHLYWCLFWGRELKNRKDAPRYKKLSHHIDNRAAYTEVDATVQDALLNELFAIHLDAILGCLRCGLYAQLPKVIQASLKLANESGLTIEDGQGKLLRRCLHAFALTDDADILIQVLEAIHGSADIIAETNKRITDAYVLFTELAGLGAPKMACADLLAGYCCHAAAHSDADDLGAFEIHVRIRACWVRVTFLDISSRTRAAISASEPLYTYLAPANDELKDLEQWIDVLSRRLRVGGGIQELDLMDLGDAVFVHALFIRSLLDQNQEVGLSVAFNALKVLYQDVALAVEEVGKEILKPVLVGAKHPKHLAKALLFDTIASAIAAQLLVLRTIVERGCEQSELAGCFAAFNDGIARLSTMCTFSFSTVHVADDLALGGEFLKDCRALFRTCAIAWSAMESDVRRRATVFRAMQMTAALNGYNGRTDLEEAANELVLEKDFWGFMATLVVAGIERDVIESSSFYLEQAYTHYEDAAVLKAEMKIPLLLEYDHVQGRVYDDEEWTRDLVKGGLFAKTLNLTDVEALLDTVYRLSGLRVQLNDGSAYRALREVLEKHAGTREEKVEATVMELLTAEDTANELIEKGALDPEVIRSKWEHAIDERSRVKVLCALVECTPFSDAVLSDSLAILKRRKETGYGNSAYLWLTYHIGKQLVNRQEVDQESSILLTHHLRAGLNRFQNWMDATVILDVTYLLMELDPTRKGEYESYANVWSERAHEIRIMRSRAYLADRRLYELYRQDYLTCKRFGLECEIPSTEIESGLNLHGPQLLQAVAQWVSTGAVVPIPIMTKNDSVVFCGQFLIVGHMLFSSTTASDASLERYRHDYRENGQQGYAAFYELVSSLPRAPKAMIAHMKDTLARLRKFNSESGSSQV